MKHLGKKRYKTLGCKNNTPKYNYSDPPTLQEFVARLQSLEGRISRAESPLLPCFPCPCFISLFSPSEEGGGLNFSRDKFSGRAGAKA